MKDRFIFIAAALESIEMVWDTVQTHLDSLQQALETLLE